VVERCRPPEAYASFPLWLAEINISLMLPERQALSSELPASCGSRGNWAKAPDRFLARGGPPTLQGYGGSAAWASVAHGCPPEAMDSDREQTRIETRTALACVRGILLVEWPRAPIFFICDSPAPRRVLCPTWATRRVPPTGPASLGTPIISRLTTPHDCFQNRTCRGVGRLPAASVPIDRAGPAGSR
jgi:hypothetical protein